MFFKKCCSFCYFFGKMTFPHLPPTKIENPNTATKTTKNRKFLKIYIKQGNKLFFKNFISFWYFCDLNLNFFQRFQPLAPIGFKNVKNIFLIEKYSKTSCNRCNGIYVVNKCITQWHKSCESYQSAQRQCKCNQCNLHLNILLRRNRRISIKKSEFWPFWPSHISKNGRN